MIQASTKHGGESDKQDKGPAPEEFTFQWRESDNQQKNKYIRYFPIVISVTKEINPG